MKNTSFLVLLLFVSWAASAADLEYGSSISLVGTLRRLSGIECCFNGEERKTRFPAVILDSALSFVSPANAASNGIDTPETGITRMQLIIRSPELWHAFEANLNRKARVVCTPDHAFSGHHLTPVTCDVEHISALKAP